MGNGDKRYDTPRRIACIGGANIDRKIQSMSPIQYSTSNPAVVTESHGGVARNIAENLVRLGATPSLLTMVGDDKEGEVIVTHLASLGVDVRHIIRSHSRRTGTYTAILNHDGDMAVAFADMQIYDDLTTERIQHWMNLRQNASSLIADTNLPAQSLEYLIRSAASSAVDLIIAPVSSPKAKRLPVDLTGVCLLIANVNEIEAISEMPVVSHQDIQNAALTLQRRGCKAVVVTRGENGVAWFDEMGQFGLIPAQPVHVIDVTGAGDAFVAGVAFARAKDSKLSQACLLGMKLSTLALTTKETVSSQICPQRALAWLTEIVSHQI